ncbi:MAG TPA: L,D-transpeptidase family protein [Pyrinomonadaceae bacterium]|nr:L,D-transpeptidase family protein [Pyrinomonadaceae bacterium]
MRSKNLTPLIVLAMAMLFAACAGSNPSANDTTAKSTTTAVAENQSPPISLPVLTVLLADQKLKKELKAQLQLTDEQLASLRKISNDELGRSLKAKAENPLGSAELSSENALTEIRKILGDKTDQMLALARERWEKGRSELEVAVKAAELTMLPGPNAVPKDTRIVVNIPAFRMDVFQRGSLLKSYQIGIGYQEYPLPTGFRKAEMIIFNPTWTQPNEPWASNPGAVVAAGAQGNPLGPIKVPIGGANLIHGGKDLWKIGTFASHGCVGLTNDQVKDFAKVLAEAADTELKQESMASFLKRRNQTQVVKLLEVVPVELRYETIVLEDGRLHIYRDVYNRKTNTEENLRAVLGANGISFDTLGTEEKSQVLEALDAFSPRPTKKASAPSPSVSQTKEEKAAALAALRAEADRLKKLRSQKEIVIDINTVTAKGYPSPVDLDNGRRTATVATVKP